MFHRRLQITATDSEIVGSTQIHTQAHANVSRPPTPPQPTCVSEVCLKIIKTSRSRDSQFLDAHTHTYTFANVGKLENEN